MTEKPVAIVLPTWSPNEPRFVIMDCEQCSDDRVFKNNQCVYNQRLGFAYSVEEIVEVLNNIGKENDELKNNLKQDQNMRYKTLNKYYIQDTYTGIKINQKKAVELLNKYEEALNEFTQSTVKSDSNH